MQLTRIGRLAYDIWKHVKVMHTHKKRASDGSEFASQAVE